MRASPVTSPYQYDRKFPNLLSCYLQPTSPLEVLLSNYPTYSSPILTLPLNWEGFYKNPFVWDRGLTQPQLGPFLNSKLFLEKHKSNQVKTGQNRSKQTKHEKQVKIKIRVENPPHCSPYYFSHSTLFYSIVEQSTIFKPCEKFTASPPFLQHHVQTGNRSAANIY